METMTTATLKTAMSDITNHNFLYYSNGPTKKFYF